MEPLKDLYTFEGQVKIQRQDQSQDNGGMMDNVKIDINQFLHSGAVLKNSQRVLCMVVQTGPQTKLSMNLTKYRIKQSTLEHQTNMALIINVILMLSMAAALSFANYAFTERNYEKYEYLFEDAPSASELAFKVFFSFYLILNSFIPLELPIIIEITKMLTTYFM